MCINFCISPLLMLPHNMYSYLLPFSAHPFLPIKSLYFRSHWHRKNLMLMFLSPLLLYLSQVAAYCRVVYSCDYVAFNYVPNQAIQSYCTLSPAHTLGHFPQSCSWPIWLVPPQRSLPPLPPYYTSS